MSKSIPSPFSGLAIARGRAAASGDGASDLTNEYQLPAAQWGDYAPPLLDGHGALYSRLISLSTAGTPITIDAGTLDSDALDSTQTGLNTRGFNYGFNGSDWDRIRCNGTTTDNVSTQSRGALAVAGFLYGLDGSTFDRLRSARTDQDALAGITSGGLIINSIGRGFNGASGDRLRTQSQTNAALVQQLGVQLVAPPASWVESDAPAAATAAAAVHAAGGAGVQHIVTGFTVTLAAVAASNVTAISLTDGVTTWNFGNLLALAGDGKTLRVANLQIPMAVNAAATLNVGAPGATNFVTAEMEGYSV